MKNILPSECILSSHPSGRGPSSSPGCCREVIGVHGVQGMGLARPVLGSTQDVDLSLWSMKNIRPLGAICMDHPGGSPAAQ